MLLLKVVHVIWKSADTQRFKGLNSGLPDSVVLIIASSWGLEQGRERDAHLRRLHNTNCNNVFPIS